MKKCNFFLFLSFLGIIQISCSNSVNFYSVYNAVPSADGYMVSTFEFKSNEIKIDNRKPKGVFFYIQGSGCETVISRVGYLVSTVFFGGRIFVAEKRGVLADSVNQGECFKFYTKEIRVLDHLAVINYYLQDVDPSVPVILIGGSEGGDIASSIAAREPKITHLILMSSGGGISQETEIRELIKKDKEYLGLKNEKEFEEILTDIFSGIDDSKVWAGLPYRRWKTFLRDSSLKYLQGLNIPILLIHGDKDKNVPVSSARTIDSFFRKCNKRNLKYIEYKDVDHSFIDIKRNINIYPIIEIDIINWLFENKIVSEREKLEFINQVHRAHKELFENR